MRRYLTSLLLSLTISAAVQAQALNGTLLRVSESGTFTIGYVPDSAPMSFEDGNGKPTGYSIVLCLQVANAVKEATGLEQLDIRYVPLVSLESRLAAVQDHTVDIECGATTVTLSRRERVDFSLMTFITGGAVLSSSTKPIQSIQDLSGKSIAVIKGTTTESGLRKLMANNDFKVTLRLVASRVEGMELLNTAKVDGFASDRAMLVGLAFRSGDRSKYAITRDVFSFEPYALMLPRGDTNFRLVTDSALASLYRDARILRLYQDWFGRYGEAMSPLMKALYEFQAVAK